MIEVGSIAIRLDETMMQTEYTVYARRTKREWKLEVEERRG